MKIQLKYIYDMKVWLADDEIKLYHVQPGFAPVKLKLEKQGTNNCLIFWRKPNMGFPGWKKTKHQLFSLAERKPSIDLPGWRET